MYFVAIIQLKRERIMGIVIGIDVGGSTTKIVGVEDKKIKNPMFVKATDPVTSFIRGLR